MHQFWQKCQWAFFETQEGLDNTHLHWTKLDTKCSSLPGFLGSKSICYYEFEIFTALIGTRIVFTCTLINGSTSFLSNESIYEHLRVALWISMFWFDRSNKWSLVEKRCKLIIMFFSQTCNRSNSIFLKVSND